MTHHETYAQSGSEKPLILCADDFAYNVDVDDAILALIEQKRLTASSCMVLSPRWPEAAKRIQMHHRVQADFGLHLDFTEFFKPRYALNKLIIASHLLSLPTLRLKNAIHNQLDLFEEHLGYAPDYIDGHQHVHQLPHIRELCLDIAQQRYSHTLPWIRISAPPSYSGWKARIIQATGARALDRLAGQYGFRHTSTLLGVYNFKASETVYQAHIQRWLKTAQTSLSPALMMCHPAKLGISSHHEADPIQQARTVEFQVLQSQWFADALSAHKIKLVKGYEAFRSD